MNKKGMTLLELMVYMAIAALLLAPVVFLMNNSSKNMARNATNTELRMSGRDIMSLMYEDIRNLGFKLDPGTLSFYVNSRYDDGSSFKPWDGGAFDTLTFIKGKLDANGKFDGADTVRYFVEGGDSVLVRQVLGENGAPKQDLTRRLARNVAVLKFEYLEEPLGDPIDDVFSSNSNRKLVQFIKVYLILKDDKQIAAARPRAADIANYNFAPTDLAIYERHEIMIPVPNNGLFPCGDNCGSTDECTWPLSYPSLPCNDPCNIDPTGSSCP